MTQPSQPSGRLDTEAIGALLLLTAAAIALIWANSPYAGSYTSLLDVELSLSAGDASVSRALIHWINDGLMGVFFFSVGLEIKREVLQGELSTVRRASLPIIAALGGMIVPAGIYLVLNWDSSTQGGWGVPMATDIAFALGAISAFGTRVPRNLVLFLTAVAVTDDIGAILVIAIFYTGSISLLGLGIGVAAFTLACLANRAGVQNMIIYGVLGTITWLGFLESGVHATLAAVLVAFTIPARARLHGSRLVGRIASGMDGVHSAGMPSEPGLLADKQHDALKQLKSIASRGTTPLQSLERSLDPVVTFFVLPLFALANAGVPIDLGGPNLATDSVALGIVLGLVVGKPIGIFGFSWLIIKLGPLELPRGVSMGQLRACSVLGGIGFTMSMFIGGLAFSRTVPSNTAKLSILIGSIVAGLTGYILLRRSLPRSAEEGRAPEE